ncbi:DUF6188 family protein [Streptomyces sp. NPDC001380]|uniref:DUF6188 family protein n=1 Tax=Streptomyces sp. NPDC001380 TaxID=3364566 RepID=UPI00369CBE7D
MNLDLQGQTVVRVCFDYAVRILTSGNWEMIIETEAVLHPPVGEPVAFDPESPGTMAAHLVGLARDVITEAGAGDAGDLVVGFASGTRLTVRPDPDYEAWETVGPGGRRAICMPGGEVAVWSGR